MSTGTSHGLLLGELDVDGGVCPPPPWCAGPTDVQRVEVRAEDAVGVNFDHEEEVRLRGGGLRGGHQAVIHRSVRPHQLGACTTGRHDEPPPLGTGPTALPLSEALR